MTVARAAALLALVAAPFALVLSGCDQTSDGSTGDPPTTPDPDVLGNGDRLREVIGPATWFEPGNIESAGCKAPSDHQANVTGQTIVAIDRFDETGEGALGNMYIQDYTEPGDSPPPYSGVTVFAPSFTPPDLRLFEGDVVDTFGNVQEFLGPSSGLFGECKSLPEISGTMTFRFDGHVPEPLTVVQLNGGADRWKPILGYEQARQYLGMLVRIEGVIIAGNPSESKGRLNATIDMGGGISADDVIKISNELYDIKNEGPTLQGAQFQSVTGILTFFYGFHIAPRSPDDFEM
ncbi:MAG: hypothetical protein U0271_25575 [Polyangiaceae bacterium]